MLLTRHFLSQICFYLHRQQYAILLIRQATIEDEVSFNPFQIYSQCVQRESSFDVSDTSDK